MLEEQSQVSEEEKERYRTAEAPPGNGRMGDCEIRNTFINLRGGSKLKIEMFLDVLQSLLVMLKKTRGTFVQMIT